GAVSKTWVSMTLVLEFFFAFLASFLLSLPCLFKQFSLLKEWNSSVLVVGVGCFGVLVVIAGIFLSKKFKSAVADFFRLLLSEKRKLLKAFALMFIAFFIMSLSFAVLGAGMIRAELLWPFLFAFPLAWILGYLTPGSPAGMGTRELALVMLLSVYASQTEVSQVAILMRVVSLSSDVILYLGGYFLSKRVLSYECES
ncbi:MAG TPA: hypothetical protein VIG33_04490, partial [Pseudobdellovibrionaceae bacterium]